jgi:hypothetical protein
MDKHSGCGAAWLARLLGVQEVPGSNPGSPTNPFKELPTFSTTKLGLLLFRASVPLIPLEFQGEIEAPRRQR